MNRRTVIVGIGLAVSLVAVSAFALSRAAPAAAPTPPSHFADADDRAAVTAGKRIYMRACAGCHGRTLQGQPLWQLDDGPRRRAPAQDDSGHTWQHSDEAIFQMVKTGRFPGGAAASSMPALGARLSDADILRAMAFIKARWSIGLRAAQATLNPGMAGMPAAASSVDWTLPPTCAATQRRWRAVSR